MSRGKVFVSAGHSTSDPGAIGIGGVKEADIAVTYRNALAKALRDAGFTVTTDGEGSESKTLNQAITLLKAASPKIAVEFHMNAFTTPSANGVETISLPKDRELAQQISGAISQAAGIKLRGKLGWIDQSASARGKLGFVNAGGLIIELGFITNESDLNSINQNVAKITKAIVAVIERNM